MSKYINQIDSHKASVIYTLLDDMVTFYKMYLNGSILKDKALSNCERLFHYLKGFLYGLDVKHKLNYIIQNDYKLSYISFYNNSSQSIKYSLCVCFDSENFGVKYNRINKK